ncbi:MAG: hypothetical protein QNK36_03905 [Colwellia sp.]|nr:hypothetical protein [Colwellia sp.]
METEEFERLNVLSEKAINDTATSDELEEFMKLLNVWNESTEYNLLQGFYVPSLPI